MSVLQFCIVYITVSSTMSQNTNVNHVIQRYSLVPRYNTSRNPEIEYGPFKNYSRIVKPLYTGFLSQEQYGMSPSTGPSGLPNTAMSSYWIYYPGQFTSISTAERLTSPAQNASQGNVNKQINIRHPVMTTKDNFDDTEKYGKKTKNKEANTKYENLPILSYDFKSTNRRNMQVNVPSIITRVQNTSDGSHKQEFTKEDVIDNLTSEYKTDESITATSKLMHNVVINMNSTDISSELNSTNDGVINDKGSLLTNDSFKKFKRAMADMDKEFYLTSFRLLSANSAVERRDRGISFVQSGAWLHVLLMLLSGAADADTCSQLDRITRFPSSLEEKYQVIRSFVAQMPPTSESLKLKWSNRLVLGPGVNVSEEFRARARDTVGLKIDSVPGDNVTQLVETLNDMVRRDSGGALRGTLDEEDVSGGVHALLLTTLYFRSGWRAPVTLLNGSAEFRDAPAPPYRLTRMFRLNDVVGYARVSDWDAEVVEIPYATANLSLVAVVPRAVTGLRAAARRAAAEGMPALLRRLRPRRVAVTLPLFTLRMTLLLPNKLQAMGASRLVSDATGSARPAAEAGTPSGLRLSHAVQRLMFWADAGRNAFKDDGVQWDPVPEFSLLVDRPYFFMVKWNDIVLLTGNFVL